MANKESSDDDDYMSEKFLTDCADVRPGLVFKEAIKRKYKMEERHEVMNKKFATKSKKILEMEQREDGLQKAIGTENKGFALLQKMGYKPGTSLGKSGTGCLEPVPLSIKVDRGGLGRDELLKQKRKEVTDMKAILLGRRQQMLKDKSREFALHQRNKMLMRQITRDLNNSRKSCEELDRRMELIEPAESWFWPETKNSDTTNEESSEEAEEESEEEEEDDVVELQDSEKLEILTEYLRSTHLFCVWCGTQYQDADDLSTHCPGKTYEDH